MKKISQLWPIILLASCAVPQTPLVKPNLSQSNAPNGVQNPNPDRGNTNQKPIIDALEAKVTEEAQTVRVQVQAHDPEGEAIIYRWKTEQGTLSNQTGAETSWSAKDFNGQFKQGITIITVTVEDSRGASDTASLNLYVTSEGNIHLPDTETGQTVSTKDGTHKQKVEIRVNQEQFLIPINESSQLTAELLLEDGSTSKQVQWHSTAPHIVSINETGKVLRLAAGEAEIIVYSELHKGIEKRVRILDPNNQTILQPVPQNPSTQTENRPETEPPKENNHQINQTEPHSLPSAPTHVAIQDISATGATVTWQASTHASHYSVFLDGTRIANQLSSTQYTFQNLSANTHYLVSIVAENETGVSPQSQSIALKTPSTGPSFTGRIFYTTGYSSIYMLESGRDPKLLSHNETAKDMALSVSPNGQSVYYSDHLEADFSLFHLNLSTGQRSLLIPFYTNIVSQTKDGTKIVFDGRHERSGYFNLYTANSNGSNIQQITTENHRNRFPEWSPDNSLIAFGSRRDGQYEIYTAKPDGTEQTRRTQNLDIKETHLHWSLDGQLLYFVNNSDRIFSIGIHTGATQSIPGQTGQCHTIKDIAISPNNGHLALLGDCGQGIGLYMSSMQNFAPEFLAATSFGIYNNFVDWAN